MKSLLGNSLAIALVFSVLQVTAHAAIIIDGTDANDHGSASGGINFNGWEYMQRALENLAPTVSGKPNTLVVLGTSPGSGQAANAITSAFNLSTLAGTWTIHYVNGSAALTSYFGGNPVGGATLAGTGIMYITTAGNSSGDLDSTEVAVLNANAAQISNHASSGGSLFAMAESGPGAFGWLNTLIPGITFTDVGSGGIGTNVSLTAAGSAAFPGLTNADLAGADPWHGHFSGNLGGLQVLGTAPDFSSITRNVIIGTGQVSGGFNVPEPTTCVGWTIFGLGLACSYRRKSKAQ